MMSAVIIASIALAVVLGYKTKINTGLFCIAFAYLIGCFALGMKTKALIACWPTNTMFVILSVSLFYNFAAANGTLESKIDVGLVAICFTVIALLLDLAPQKEVIARVPWNTIIMIAGAGMLIAVAVEAGTIDALSAWIGSNVPAALVPIAFSLVAAFMSFFSSTTGVVAPALFPLIPALAVSTGLNPAVLFACTVLGAQSSAISPFSSGGSLILGSCGKEEERNALFNRLLFIAVPVSVVLCAAYNLIVAMIL